MTQMVGEGDTREIRGTGTFASIQNRDFLVYLVGGAASFLGMQMQMVAQGWLVLDLTNSPFYLGLVGAVSSVPIIVL